MVVIKEQEKRRRRRSDCGEILTDKQTLTKTTKTKILK